MNRRRVFVLTLALAFCLAIGIRAAQTDLDLLDYDAVKALDHQFTVERLDKESNTMDLSGTARMEHSADEPHPYPSFTVTVDSGQTLTVDENRIRGDLPLLRVVDRRHFGSPPPLLAWIYTIPYSERYEITLDPDQEEITRFFDGYQGPEGEPVLEDDPTQGFYLTASGAGAVEYAQTQCALSGQSMTYELSPHHFKIRQEAESGSRICYMAVTLTGQGERQARIYQDGNDVLVYSQDAPCQVTAEVRWQPDAPESHGRWESQTLDLGQWPAGQWGADHIQWCGHRPCRGTQRPLRRSIPLALGRDPRRPGPDGCAGAFPAPWKPPDTSRGAVSARRPIRIPCGLPAMTGRCGA